MLDTTRCNPIKRDDETIVGHYSSVVSWCGGKGAHDWCTDLKDGICWRINSCFSYRNQFGDRGSSSTMTLLCAGLLSPIRFRNHERTAIRGMQRVTLYRDLEGDWATALNSKGLNETLINLITSWLAAAKKQVEQDLRSLIFRDSAGCFRRTAEEWNPNKIQISFNCQSTVTVLWFRVTSSRSIPDDRSFRLRPAGIGTLCQLMRLMRWQRDMNQDQHLSGIYGDTLFLYTVTYIPEIKGTGAAYTHAWICNFGRRVVARVKPNLSRVYQSRVYTLACVVWDLFPPLPLYIR